MRRRRCQPAHRPACRDPRVPECGGRDFRCATAERRALPGGHRLSEGRNPTHVRCPANAHPLIDAGREMEPYRFFGELDRSERCVDVRWKWRAPAIGGVVMRLPEMASYRAL